MEDKTAHSFILNNRKHLTMEGVLHVENFDDDTIVLATDMGTLTIKGHNLRIQSLDLDHHRFVAEGEFDAMVYGKKKGGRRDASVWKKMWR